MNEKKNEIHDVKKKCSIDMILWWWKWSMNSFANPSDDDEGKT